MSPVFVALQSGESDWLYVLESVDSFNRVLVEIGLDDFGEKEESQTRTLIHGQRWGREEENNGDNICLKQWRRECETLANV
jgi:hypothetical protein